jgi:hypothetical protein
MLGHEPEVARLLHREHMERLACAARQAPATGPAAAAWKPTSRTRLVGLARLHSRARV